MNHSKINLFKFWIKLLQSPFIHSFTFMVFVIYEACWFHGSKILQVFNVIPTNKVKDFVGLQMHIAKVPLCETVPQLAEEYLQDLIGTLVEFPLNFLANVCLAPSFASKEGIIPSSVFT